MEACLSGRQGLGVGNQCTNMKKREIIPYNPKLIPLAKKLRSNMTLSEVLLWQELKGKQMLGYDFDRQKPIDNYIVDFYCKDLKLVIEIDGQSHEHEEVSLTDKKSQAKLESLGVRFLRFDDLEVKREMKYVLNQIHSWIIENTYPYPSQEGIK